ncbi:phospholipase A [Thermodesulfobacteriota bacterium]
MLAIISWAGYCAGGFAGGHCSRAGQHSSGTAWGILLILLLVCITTPVLAEQIDPPPIDNSNTKGETVISESSPPQYQSLDAVFSLYQPYMTNLSSYEPIYFLLGTELEKSRFQFSFKYRFLNSEGPWVSKHPWMNGFHFGYTQTSFWNLKSDSLPFEDTSYKPELFHLTGNIGTRPDRVQGLFIQTGMQHESNGQADLASRSTNTLYINPIFTFYDPESKYGGGFSTKFMIYFDNSRTGNPDLEHYRGNFELRFGLGKSDGLVFFSNLRWAKEGGSVQMDLTYPLGNTISHNVNIYFHIQYVNALAEGLLHYQDRTEVVRIGISFLR